MTRRACTLTTTTIGGAVGAIVAYMLFTEEGRAWRRRLEPALDQAAAELGHFRTTVQKAGSVASDGWKLLNDALEGRGVEQPSRYGDPHQTTPF